MRKDVKILCIPIPWRKSQLTFGTNPLYLLTLKIFFQNESEAYSVEGFKGGALGSGLCLGGALPLQACRGQTGETPGTPQ